MTITWSICSGKPWKNRSRVVTIPPVGLVRAAPACRSGAGGGRGRRAAGGLGRARQAGPGASRRPICNARVTCMRGDVVPLARGGLEEDTAALWRALADPTRRRILDLLRQRPLITGEIA